MGARNSATSDTEAEILEGGIRALQGNELADEGELVAEHGEDALVAGARSIADIDKVMADLQMARDYCNPKPSGCAESTAAMLTWRKPRRLRSRSSQRIWAVGVTFRKLA